jgi:hypothetical protein
VAGLVACTRERVHAIRESDHLHQLEVSIGDVIAAPADATFDWRLEERGALFQPYGPLRMRAAAAGDTQLVARGDPKCRKSDGGCGISTREWTVFVRVR